MGIQRPRRLAGLVLYLLGLLLTLVAFVIYVRAMKEPDNGLLSGSIPAGPFILGALLLAYLAQWIERPSRQLQRLRNLRNALPPVERLQAGVFGHVLMLLVMLPAMFGSLLLVAWLARSHGGLFWIFLVVQHIVIAAYCVRERNFYLYLIVAFSLALGYASVQPGGREDDGWMVPMMLLMPYSVAPVLVHMRVETWWRRAVRPLAVDVFVRLRRALFPADDVAMKQAVVLLAVVVGFEVVPILDIPAAPPFVQDMIDEAKGLQAIRSHLTTIAFILYFLFLSNNFLTLIRHALARPDDRPFRRVLADLAHMAILVVLYIPALLMVAVPVGLLFMVLGTYVLGYGTFVVLLGFFVFPSLVSSIYTLLGFLYIGLLPERSVENLIASFRDEHDTSA